MQEHANKPESEMSTTPFKRGKVKDIYEIDSEELLFVFTDRVSAYDIVLPSAIPRKGEVLCKLAAYWFNYLKIPHHMVRVEDANRMVVRRLKMIPVECVVRGYLYGSIYEKMSERADKAGFILADLKLEFGFDAESNIVLADSIGPDEFRLWPKENYSPGKNQESYDKQLIRD